MGRYLLLLGVLLLGMARAAFSAVEMQVLYNGEATLPDTATFGVWGALQDGAAPAFTPQPVAPKIFGIPLALQGRYQGVRIDFPTPLNTDAFLGKTDAFLELYLRAALFTPSARVPMPPLTSIRVTFFTQGGVNTLAVPAQDFYPLDEVGGNWVRLALPLNRMNAKYPLGGEMRRLLITTDSPVKLLLGRFAFIRDVAMLRARITTMPAAPHAGEPITFVAGVEGGLTPYQVSWNFGLTPDATTIDASGEGVTTTFPKAGSYTVSCTVRDTDGIKDPITVTRTVLVAAKTVTSGIVIDK